MKFLVDTDICVYAVKQHSEVVRRLMLHPPVDLAVSVITEAKLRAGAAKSNAAAKATRLLEAFLAPLEIIDVNSGDARIYAQVRSKLERAGTPIGPFDTLIAAQAVARDLTLVTNNEREFRRVAGLRIENWAS